MSKYNLTIQVRCDHNISGLYQKNTYCSHAISEVITSRSDVQNVLKCVNSLKKKLV